jgi:hypothetical protein
MKSFLAASLFFVVMLALSALVFEFAGNSTTAAFSTESARVGTEAAPDGRLGWAAPGEAA